MYDVQNGWWLSLGHQLPGGRFTGSVFLQGFEDFTQSPLALVFVRERFIRDLAIQERTQLFPAFPVQNIEFEKVPALFEEFGNGAMRVIVLPFPHFR